MVGTGWPRADALGKVFSARVRRFRRKLERWTTPDGDFVDLHRLDRGNRDTPRLFFLHGLEGTVRSHYVAGFFGEAARRGWGADLLIFRGCGDEPNRAPRFYHSGETGDLAFALDRVMSESPDSPDRARRRLARRKCLLKFLGERGSGVIAAARRGGGDLGAVRPGARRAIHLTRVLANLRPPFPPHAATKGVRQARAFSRPLRSIPTAKRATSIYEFDDAVTAPVHGFADAHDYYAKSSSLGCLDRIARPTLLLSAIDDPFLPPAVLDEVRVIAAGIRIFSSNSRSTAGTLDSLAGASHGGTLLRRMASVRVSRSSSRTSGDWRSTMIGLESRASKAARC